MAKGRKPDPHQEQKGFPNRRRSAVQKREEEQQRVADLLARTVSDDGMAPPAMIDQGPLYAGAVAVWREMAPRLAKTHRLHAEHKMIFSMFCVYYADWISLNDQLKREGETQVVKTVSGDKMIRDHPGVRRRQECYGNIMELSKRFGLTPIDGYDLFKNQALVANINPGLFGSMPVSAPKQDSQAIAEASMDAPHHVGMLAKMDSSPPGQKPN